MKRGSQRRMGRTWWRGKRAHMEFQECYQVGGMWNTYPRSEETDIGPWRKDILVRCPRAYYRRRYWNLRRKDDTNARTQPDPRRKKCITAQGWSKNYWKAHNLYSRANRNENHHKSIVTFNHDTVTDNGAIYAALLQKQLDSLIICLCDSGLMRGLSGVDEWSNKEDVCGG